MIIDIRPILLKKIAFDLIDKIKNRGVNLDDYAARYQYSLFLKCKHVPLGFSGDKKTA